MTHHTDAQLLPCPFCCAGITSIRENGKMWTGQRYSEPTSVSVMHHCEPVDGQPSRAIERVGRDMESAVAAWNRRAPAAPVPQGWIDPNDKAQKQYLPHIGERVLFKHDGRVYLGKHTGGSFKAEYPFGKTFGTWDCVWMYPIK